MNRLFKRISENQIVKAIIILVSGNLLAQFLPMVISPILSRVYSPSEYAIYGQFSSITGIISSLCCFKYEQAILISESEEESRENTINCLGILIISTMILLGLLFILTPKRINGWYGLGVTLWVIPVEFLFYGLHMIVENYHIKNGNYRIISTSKVSKALGQSTGQLGISLFSNSIGLSLGYSCGTILSTIVLAIKFPIKRTSTSLKSFAVFVKKYIRYPIYFMPGTLLNTLAFNISNLLLCRIYDDSLVGLFSFSIRLLGMPVALLGDAIRKVFIKMGNDEMLADHTTKKTFTYMFKILLLFSPAFVLLFIIAPLCFGFVFGEEWNDAGMVTRYLVPMYLSNFLYSPLSGVCVIYRKEKQFMLLQLLLLCSAVLPYIIYQVLTISFYDYLLLYSLFMSFSYMVMLVYCYLLNRKHNFSR